MHSGHDAQAVIVPYCPRVFMQSHAWSRCDYKTHLPCDRCIWPWAWKVLIWAHPQIPGGRGFPQPRPMQLVHTSQHSTPSIRAGIFIWGILVPYKGSKRKTLTINVFFRAKNDKKFRFFSAGSRKFFSSLSRSPMMHRRQNYSRFFHWPRINAAYKKISSGIFSSRKKFNASSKIDHINYQHFSYTKNDKKPPKYPLTPRLPFWTAHKKYTSPSFFFLRHKRMGGIRKRRPKSNKYQRESLNVSKGKI